MPVQPTYPGVYVQELSSGVHAISGVATSIAAFVGYTAFGPDGVAQRLLGFTDYQRIFGGLAADSELSYAVQQFFANGGTTAYVVRVPRTGAKQAILIMNDAAAAGSLDLTARSTGTWANNLVFDVDYEKAADSSSFNLTITNTATGQSESFPGLSIDNTKANFAVSVINDPDNGSSLVSAAADAGAGKRPQENGLCGGKVDFSKLAQTLGEAVGVTVASKSYTLGLYADLPAALQSPGAGKPAVTATFLNAGDPIPDNVVAACRTLEKALNLALRSAQAGATVRCLPRTSSGSAAPDSIRVVAQFPAGVVPAAVDAILTITAGTPNDAAAALKLTGGTAVAANVARYWVGANRTAGAEKVSQAPSDGSGLPATSAIVNALDALDKIDLFNLLCIPDATRASAGNPNQLDSTVDYNAIFSAAMGKCLLRRAFLMLDPPPDVTDVDKAAAWRATKLSVHDLNGAVYWPRLRLPDPLNNGALRSFAPCGVLAGVYARTDGDRGVWKAPAGIEATLSGVQKLTYTMNDAENGVLNPIALNALRTFPVYGQVSWGARTLVGADGDNQDWKYVPVRRLALFLEESLYRGLKWAVFEPNADPLWAQIRLNVGAFLQDQFRLGAFAGSTPKQAYFVKCDSETTTSTDQALGIVNVVVGFAPLEPAEFVVITIQQMAGQQAA
jgi:phage tail sheath protein FI